MQAKQRLVSAFEDIQATLKQLHTFFEADGEEVQREWVRFTAKVDRKVEDALRTTVRRSLQELSRLLNGDSKTEVLPIFRCAAGWQCRPRLRCQAARRAVLLVTLDSCDVLHSSLCAAALQGHDCAGAQPARGAAADHPGAV